ncbi:MAG: hypothetical protein OXU61_04475, partial [Gammaproteobacteria bacterium]|nr:hypothetical protein [Gammaproteobacteria bacterium]
RHRANVRVPRSICAGFPPLFKPGAGSAREWRIFAVPVGSFSGGSGFSGFLHSLFRGNGRNSGIMRCCFNQGIQKSLEMFLPPFGENPKK